MNELKPIRDSPSCQSIEVGIFVGVSRNTAPWKSLSDGRRGVCDVSLPKGDSSKSALKAKQSAEAADGERLFNSKSKRK